MRRAEVAGGGAFAAALLLTVLGQAETPASEEGRPDGSLTDVAPPTGDESPSPAPAEDAPLPDAPPEPSPPASPPPAAPPPAAPPPVVAPSVLATASAPTPPTAPPIERLVMGGAWLVGVDDALPLLSTGSAAPSTGRTALRIGDPGGLVHPFPPRPVFVDHVFGGRLTAGASPIVELSPTTSTGSLRTLGFAARAGYLVPFGARVAFWPRAGVAHLRTDTSDAEITTRTDLIADVRIVWSPRGSWALTLGPSIALPLDSDKEVPTFSLAGPPIEPADPQLRVGIAGGLVVRLDADGGTGGPEARTPRFLLGVERAVPLVRFRVEGGRTGEMFDYGTSDTTSRFPVMPRVAFDLVVKEWTVGIAANAGYVRTSASELVPGDGPDAFVFGAAPRVGALLPISRHVALWPRAGVTWVRASMSRPDLGATSSFHLGADLDALAVVMPVEGVGITIGPSLTLPLASGGRETALIAAAPETPWLPGVERRVEYSYLAVGISAGVVLLL